MSPPVMVPADVDIPDRVLAGLTARQLGVLALTATLLYASWVATRSVLPALVYLAVIGVPLAAAGSAAALTRRDGIGWDALALAALSHALGPRRYHHPDDPDAGTRHAHDAGVPAWLAGRAHHTHRPPRSAPLPEAAMPAHQITPTPAPGEEFSDIAVLDLGSHGAAVVAVVSTLAFTLRTEDEQTALVECFAQALHSQDGPLQILVRTQPIDLTPTLAQLARAASALDHPALRAAAAGYHDWLAELSATSAIHARQVLLVLREPAPHPHSPTAVAATHARLVCRLSEARRCLAAAELTLTPLTGPELAWVLATSTDPARRLPTTPTHPGLSTHHPHWPSPQNPSC